MYSASALEKASYEALIETAKAAMVFTDPPYNVAIEGNVSGLGATHHREFAMASEEMDEAEYTAFLSQACSNLAANSTREALHLIFVDWRHIGELLAAGRNVYTEELESVSCRSRNRALVWARSIAVAHAFDFCLQARRRAASEQRHARQIWSRSDKRMALSGSWRTPATKEICSCCHPTVKPVRLVAPTPCSTALPAATSCSTLSSAAVLR